MTADQKYKLKFGDNLQKAYSLYQHALKYNYHYITLLSRIAAIINSEMKGELESNLMTISSKINSNTIEKNNSFRIWDIMKVTFNIN